MPEHNIEIAPFRGGRTPGTLIDRYISPRWHKRIDALDPLPALHADRKPWHLRQRATLGAEICKADAVVPGIVAEALEIDEALIVAELTYERKDATGEQILRRADARAIARTYDLLDQIQDRMAEVLGSGERIKLGELTKAADVAQRTISAYRRWSEPDQDIDPGMGKTLADVLKAGGKLTVEGPRSGDDAIDVTPTEQEDR